MSYFEDFIEPYLTELYDSLPEPQTNLDELYKALAESGKWRTAKLEIVTIADMSTDHLENTVSKFKRNELALCVHPCIVVMGQELEKRLTQRKRAFSHIEKLFKKV